MKEEKKQENQNIEETAPTVNTEKIEAIEIGKVREEKKGSSIIIFIFFIILLASIICLPYIETWINKLTGKVEEVETPVKKPEETKDKEDEIPEINYYTFDSAVIVFEDIKLTDFALNNEENVYSISYKAISNINSSIYLSGKKYFIELYNSDKTLIERVMFQSNKTLNSNQTISFEYEISENTYLNATEFILIKKELTDYPAIHLDSTEGISSLTCEKGTSKYIYTFENDILIKVDNTENYLMSVLGDTYDAILTSKRNEVASIGNIEGASATLVEGDDTFVINTVINPSIVKSSIFDYKFYTESTYSKTIKYELESMRYTCK